ncbi:hypothetical protein GCE9029_02618 [Grimontia celer]|uniref:Uncharacterized protein n=1 Tax=Grimontia celer TaxID=1796497 RepID=A0A128F4S2_9GAMM|nr:hypothetical protein [Grimontia celer]CZF81450.1 hypothetical protein GCE9029_02618 [Grimontia celer]
MKSLFGSITLYLVTMLAAVMVSATETIVGDKDDPTSISSFVGLRTGTNGYGAIFQVGLNDEESTFGHNSFFQLKNDFETAHLRHFSVYKGSGTGIFFDGQHDNSGQFAVNRASLGVIQIIPVGDNLRMNPALLYGETWTDDERVKRTAFPNTSIATLYTFVRWQVSDDWFVNLVPQYTYSLDGRKIRLFEMVTQVGHNISPETSLAINADEDDEFWLTIKHAF